MRCLDCHYDLKNLSEHRCPECGRPFNPGDSETFDTDSARTRRLICIIATLVGCYVVLLWMLVAFHHPIEEHGIIYMTLLRIAGYSFAGTLLLTPFVISTWRRPKR